MKWQQHEQQNEQPYFSGNGFNDSNSTMFCSSLQQDSSSLPHFLPLQIPTVDVTSSSSISRTFSCPPLLPDPKLIDSSSIGKHNSSKKRKSEKLKVCMCVWKLISMILK
jgi:hypothetical protein